MKLQSYQLSRWCDAGIHGHHKWFWLAGNVLLLLLAVLLGLLWLILPVLLLANAVLALYLLHQHHAFGAIYQRKPRPQDALCETVLIDAALIGQGTRLRAAAQPIDVAESLSMRLGSGTLLLGAAMTLTADELPPADRAAILSAVHDLNIKPSRMRSHNPVLRREQEGSLSVVTVRDGMSERRYYLGNPEALAQRCPAIWEGHTRPMSEHDHTRIADTARYIIQGNCRVLAWATALEYEEPVFLGIAGVGEDVRLPALQDVSALRAMGLTVMLEAGDQPDTDLESLRTLMDLEDYHARADVHLTRTALASEVPLGITCQPGDSLSEPVSLMRQRFRIIEDTLRRFAQLLGLTLVLSLLAGSTLTPFFLSAMLLGAAIAIGVDLTAPRLRWPTMLGVCALAIGARIFLNGQPVPVIFAASGLISVATAICAALRLCGKGFILRGPGRQPSLILLGAAALLTIGLIVYALLQGLSALLPLGFTALICAVIVLLMIFEPKIIK